MTERPHTRLKSWQTSMEFTSMVYAATERFPRSERFGLISQLRRAAVSVPANLAEGAARQFVKEQLQFFFIARGSLSELDTLVRLSQQLYMLDQAETERLLRKIDEVSSLVQGLITHNQRRA